MNKKEFNQLINQIYRHVDKVNIFPKLMKHCDELKSKNEKENYYEVSSHEIFEISWVIHDLLEIIDEYDYDNDEYGSLFTFLHFHANRVLNEFDMISRILSKLSILTWNENPTWRLKKSNVILMNQLNAKKYDPDDIDIINYPLHMDIHSQVINDCHNFEISLYSRVYNFNSFIIQLDEKINSKVKWFSSKPNNAATSIFKTIKNKKMIKNQKIIAKIGEIINLLNANNDECYKKFFDNRCKYIHEGISIFDYSECIYNFYTDDIHQKMFELIKIFLSYILNYSLFLVLFKLKNLSN